MSFPINHKYIVEAELELKVKFPTKFKTRMIQSNGGELISDEFDFELYPFFDKSNKKRISRTCNHIVLETKNARKWNGFPQSGIAIGSDGLGNQIILTHKGNGMLGEDVYFWSYETGKIERIGKSINELEE